MNTPTLIVMGAMKAGTTTAHDLLSAREQVTMLPKESGWLREPRQLDPDCVVDVCSDYARLHRFPEMLSEARRSLPIDTPMLYILRDPVDRAVSHARHLTSLGSVDRTTAFDVDGDIVQTSSYGRQLTEWMDVGFHNIALIDFHQLGTELPAAIERHLGADVSESAARERSEVHANATSTLRSTRSFIRPIVRSSAYRSVRRIVPNRLREAAKQSLLTASPADIRPTAPQLRRMVEHFSVDLAQLCSLEIDVPEWCAEWAARNELEAK